MAFVKKTWKDRLSEFPKRWKLKSLGTSGDTQSVELELDDGTVITQGDRFTAATMNDLEQRIADGFASSTAGVSSFNGRVGDVSPGSSDYSSNMIAHTNPDSTSTTAESAINGKADSTRLRSGGTTGTDFYFDYKNGQFGWNSSSARGADTFHPFKSGTVHTLTKSITSKILTDLGSDHSYRYIDTTGVVNTNSGTYTASSRGASLDMGASNSYRYVNTNSVPNSNSGTYTFPSGDMGGTKDMGASNSYRYVNAEHVYYKGVADGRGTLFFDYYNFSLTVTTSGSSHATATVDVNVGQSGRTTKAAFIANVYCRAMARYIADLYLVTCSLSGNTATVSITVRGEQGPSTGDHVFNGQIAVVYI